jgi:hypothetical protein
VYVVRGNHYTVQQAVGLYPTSATSDDYAFSRHVYSYTIEFGETFVPPFNDISNIIKDVCAAMGELCWVISSDVEMLKKIVEKDVTIGA